MCQVPPLLFQRSPVAHTDTHNLPPTYILPHTHRHIHMHSYKCEQRTFGDISRCSAWTSALSHLFGKTLLISKCKKKKKKQGNTLCVLTTSSRVEVPQEFFGSQWYNKDMARILWIFPFSLLGQSPILRSYLRSGPSLMCDMVSSFWEASFRQLDLSFPGC